MRQDNELTRLLEDRYKKVYDPCMDEMVSKEELARRTKERSKSLYVGYDIGSQDHSAVCIVERCGQLIKVIDIIEF